MKLWTSLLISAALCLPGAVLADKGGTPNHGKSAGAASPKARDVACDHVPADSHAFVVLGCVPPPPPPPPCVPGTPGCVPPPPPPPPG